MLGADSSFGRRFLSSNLLCLKLTSDYATYLVVKFQTASFEMSACCVARSLPAGLLIAVAPRYRYCSGATFGVAVAVAPLLLAKSSGDSSAATFLAAF